MTHVVPHTRICDQTGSTALSGDCAVEPPDLTYPRARAILHAHDRHHGCRQWIAAAAYLSAGLDYE